MYTIRSWAFSCNWFILNFLRDPEDTTRAKNPFSKEKTHPGLGPWTPQKPVSTVFFILNILRGIRFEPVVCPPVVGRYIFKALPPTYLTILSWHACFTDCWELKYLIQNNFGFSGRRSRPRSSLFFPDKFCCTCRCPRPAAGLR